MRTAYNKIFILLIISIFATACEEQPEKPSSVQISAQESGLIGTWRGVEMTNEFAIPLLNENGEVVLNDKLEEMSTDTLVKYTASASENVWNEVLSLRSVAGVDTFDVFKEMEFVGTDSMMAARNLDLVQGHWAVIKTTDPEGMVDDVTSLMIFDPHLPHNPNNSFSLAVKEVTGNQLVLQYGYGESLNDSLITKTYEKIN
jgi:hypothetical protein